MQCSSRGFLLGMDGKFFALPQRCPPILENLERGCDTEFTFQAEHILWTGPSQKTVRIRSLRSEEYTASVFPSDMILGFKYLALPVSSPILICAYIYLTPTDWKR